MINQKTFEIMKKFIQQNEAEQYVSKLGKEFAVVKNPDYIHPPFELYPLAPKITQPLDNLAAVVMDMDGTTTTTEPLCIHSLEFMVRRITDRISDVDWQGLNPERDYPFIIGNSTTKHVEYLIETYQQFIRQKALKLAYLQSAIWFLTNGQDEKRIAEVKQNLINLGGGSILHDEKLTLFIERHSASESDLIEVASHLFEKYGDQLQINSFNDYVRAAIDIYYQRYHQILGAIRQGKSEALAPKLLKNKTAHLIEPMPGIGFFLALTKGWLGEDTGRLLSSVFDQYPSLIDHKNVDQVRKQIIQLGLRFKEQPLKIAVVTSSILYEAQIVMTEVFRVLKKQIENWDISNDRRWEIAEKFSSYENVYDALITASDSNEIRLKPHRDLYSIALHQLGIPREKFNQVVGFEDSESGTIAIRAAGIGLCVAVPFTDTQHHDLSAASFVLENGIPEALLKYNLFLKG